MANNEIKLSILFDDDGALKGLEEINRVITKVGNTASTATQQLKTMQTELRAQQAASRNIQSPLPRNTQEFRSNPAQFTQQFQRDQQAAAREQVAETKRLMGEAGRMAAESARVLTYAMQAQTQNIITEYADQLRHGILEWGDIKDIRQKLAPIVRFGREVADKVGGRMGNELNRAIDSMLNEVIGAVKNSFGQIQNILNVSPNDLISGALRKNNFKNVDISRGFAEVENAIKASGLFDIVGPLQKTIQEQIVSTLRSQFTSSNFSHGKMWSEVSAAIAAGMGKLNIFPSEKEIGDELSRQLISAYQNRPTGTGTASAAEKKIVDAYRAQLDSIIPTQETLARWSNEAIAAYGVKVGNAPANLSAAEKAVIAAYRAKLDSIIPTNESLTKWGTEAIAAYQGVTVGGKVSSEIEKAVVAAIRQKYQALLAPTDGDIADKFMNQLRSEIATAGARGKTGNAFKGAVDGLNLSKLLQTDEVLREWFKEIEVAMLRANGDISKAFNQFQNYLKSRLGTNSIADQLDIANEIKQLPGAGEKMANMIREEVKMVQLFQEAIAGGAKKAMAAPAINARKIADMFVTDFMQNFFSKSYNAAPSASTTSYANRFFTNNNKAQVIKYSGNPSAADFVGPQKPINLKVADEGAIKNSAGALMRWKEAALSAAGAAKSAQGTMTGFGKAIGGMNLNALFHGFLNLPNRISFAWWKLNNMFFLVSQGVNIVQGAFKGLTAGLMASNELFEMHRRLGYSITFLQNMQIAAKMTDSSLANLQVTLKNLSIAVGTAQKQTPTPQRTALLRLQDYLGPDKVKEVFKDTPGATGDVMENFAKSSNKGEMALRLLQETMIKSRKEMEETGKTALSAGEKLEIFTALGGRGAFATLLPVLEKMADADFSRVLDQMSAMGVILGTNEQQALKNAEAAEKFRETWAQVANLPLGAITQFDIGAAPGLTASLERVRDLARELNFGGGGLEALGAKFGTAVFQMVDRVTDRLREFAVEIKTLGGVEAFGNLAEDLGQYLGETIPGIVGRIIPAMAEVAKRGAEGFIEGLKTAISSDSISAILIGAVSGIALGDTFEQLARGSSAAKFLGPLAPILGTALGGAITGALAGAIANAAANNKVKELGTKIGKTLGDTISAGIKILLNITDLSSGIIPQAIKIGKELASGILTGINQSLRENFGTNLFKVISGAIVAINIGSLLSKAFAAAFGVVQFVGLQAGLSAALSTALTGGLLPTIMFAGRFIGSAFMLAFTNPLVGLGVAVAAYILGQTAEFQQAAATSGQLTGNSWIAGFIAVLENTLPTIIDTVTGLIPGVGLANSFAGQFGYSAGDIAGKGLGALNRSLTGLDLSTIGSIQKDQADQAGYDAGKAFMTNYVETIESQVPTASAKLQALAKPLGLLVNPQLDASGQKRLTEQFNEIEILNQRKRTLIFDMQAALDAGDKAGAEALKDQLSEAQGRVDAIVRKAQAAKDVAKDPEGESIAQETERRKREEAERLAAERRAAAEQRKDENARAKVAQQVAAALEISQALAASPGFDDLSNNLIKAEAAAQGITKGLDDSVVQAGLLSVAITKQLTAAAENSQKRHDDITNEKERLDLINQYVEAGKSYEEAELRASAVKESQIPLLERLRELVLENETGAKKEADLVAISNQIARERINIEDEINNKIKERINQAQQEANAAKRNLDDARAVANNEKTPDQVRVDRAADGAVDAEEARLKRLAEAFKIAAENAARGVISLAETMKDSLGQVFDGLIDGTKNFSDIFSDIGKQWGRKLFNSILDEKIGFDTSVKANFLGLAEYATDAFGGIFDAAGFDGIGSFFKGLPEKAGKLFGTGAYKSSDAYINELVNGSGSSGGSIGGSLPGGDGSGSGSGINWDILNNGSNLGQQGYKYLFGDNTGSGTTGGFLGNGGGDIYTGAGSIFFNGGAESSFGVPGLDAVNYGVEPSNYVEAASGAAEFGDSGANSVAGAGGGAAGAVAGAIGGFQTASMLGDMIFVKGSTGLQGLAQRGAEGDINSNAKIINDIIGTALGAIFSMFLGPFGGIVGGAVASVVGASVVGNITRDTLRKREFTGGAGEWAQWVEGPAGLGPKVIFKALGIPTLGTALRRGGESILDATETFGNKGFQGKYGDFTRDKGKVTVNGEVQRLDRNYETGAQTAMDRGMTKDQVDRVLGASAVIYSQVGKNEKYPQDAGQLLQQMGQGMAELVSRGFADGMTFDEIKAQFGEMAKELGIDMDTAIRGLPLLLKQVKASGRDFGMETDMEQMASGAKVYAQALLGIDTIFSQDLPTGVNIAALALQTMEKDGTKALGSLTGKSSDFYTKLANNSELFQQVVADLVKQGYEIDSEELINKVKDVSASAAAVGSVLTNVFDGQDVTAGIAGLGQSIKDEVGKAAKEALTTELLKDTNIGQTFEKAFSVVRKLQEGDFDLSKSAGVEEFARQLREGIEEGHKNLLEYAPLLKQLREQFDEAMKLTTPEELAADLIVKTEEALTSLKSIASDAFGNAIEAPNAAAAMLTFANDMSKSVRNLLVDAIKEAFSQNSIINESLSKSVGTFRQAISLAMQDGFLDPTEQTNIRNLFIFATRATTAATSQLLPLIRSTMEIIDKTSEGIALRIADLREALTGGTQSGFESFISQLESNAEAKKSGDGKTGKDTVEPAQAFADSIYETVRQSLLSAIIDAFTQAALMEGILAPLMDSVGTTIREALKDKVITPQEQAAIKESIRGVGAALRDSMSWSSTRTIRYYYR